MAHSPRPLIGLLAGAAAGLVASAAMAAFQAKTAKVVDLGDGDPATVKAADAASKAVTGDKVPEPYREKSGQLVHYVAGATIGGIYGVLTEYSEDASAGFGSAYGLATSALLDEVAVPVLGLGSSPTETPAEVHAYGVAAHVVYGIVLEGVRALLVGRR